MLVAQMMRGDWETTAGSKTYPGPVFGSGMFYGQGYGNEFPVIHFILAVVTWVIFVVVLIALARWLWYKGDKEKKGK